jgi:hypothetical protein
MLHDEKIMIELLYAKGQPSLSYLSNSDYSMWAPLRMRLSHSSLPLSSDVDLISTLPLTLLTIYLQRLNCHWNHSFNFDLIVIVIVIHRYHTYHMQRSNG